MIQAVILAAGYSSRANTNKLALTIESIPILTRIVMTLQHVCHDIVVVTGHFHDEVKEMLADVEGVRLVHNSDYPKGMFSSVKKGMSAVTNDCFLVPGDYPDISPLTIEKLLKGKGDLRVPLYEGRRGHPIFISKELIEPLLNHPDDSNLKVFRDQYEVEYIEVKDAGVVMDVDTIDDYQLMKKRVEGC